MLEFDAVNVSIAKIPILRNISFKLNAGETIALIGRNGAGKTTTLRTIMGFTEATGRIVFEGKELSAVPPHKRPLLGIGYAPEDRRLFSAFTVAENIALPGRVAKLNDAEIARRIDRAYSILPELKELGPRPAGSVSGGQGKMVALGRALMLGTKLVLLDEPFQGLAPVLANRYADALRKLRDADRSLTMVITESNPELLAQFAERTMVIERGELQAEGSELAHA